MKKKCLALALAVCLLLSVSAAFTPAVSLAAVGDAVSWDIQWGAGVMAISWQSAASASSYQVERAGARLGVYTVLDAANTSCTYVDTAPNANKYENYYRITPDIGAAFYISLEGKIFGPNCWFYDSQYHTGAAAVIDINSRNYVTAEFGSQREAIFYKPGAYQAVNALTVGFYASVYGLGRLPTDTVIGSVRCPTNGLGNNAAQTNWRSIENVNVAAGGASGLRWAVSQGAPVRRVQADAAVFDWDNGWASGGYLADSRMTGTHGSYSGQQFYYRNNHYNTAPFGFTNWHFTFEGDTGAGVRADSGSAYATGGKNTVFAAVQGLMREKPFVYLDGDTYKVFVPGWRNNARGPSWGAAMPNDGMGVGKSLDLLDDFYIAAPGNTAVEINDAMWAGKNLLLTPGTYVLDEPIYVRQPDTVVLGLGYATLVPSRNNQWGAMLVSDVEGVVVSGLLFDAWYSSGYLLRVGEMGCGGNNVDNPIFLQDVFCRAGGFVNGVCQVEVALQINANGVVADHLWLWRADRGAGWTGWDVNKADYGLFVSGDHVKIHALFNDSFQKYTTYWEGDYGELYFMKNETPFDPTNQGVWMSHVGKARGYAQFKVANKVNHFFGAGLGAYACLTKVGNQTLVIDNAYEVPIKDDVKLHHFMAISMSSIRSNNFQHVINGVYPLANSAIGYYVSDYPLASGNGTPPGDEVIEPPGGPDPIIIIPPPPVRFWLTHLTKISGQLELGKDYLATLYTGAGPFYGYYVPDSIKITVNGAALTAGADYTYTPNAGGLSADIRIFGSVISQAYYSDGWIIIDITATGVPGYSAIAYDLADLTASGPSILYNGLPFSATLTAAEGFLVPDSVTVAGAASHSYAIAADRKTAVIRIPAINGNVTITAAGGVNYADIDYNLMGITKMPGAPSIADLGAPVGVPLAVVHSGLIMPPDVTVVMGGEVLVKDVDYSYARTANSLSAMLLVYNVTGGVTVTATAAGDIAGQPAQGIRFYLVSAWKSKIARSKDAGGAWTGNNTQTALVADLAALPGSDTDGNHFEIRAAYGTGAKAGKGYLMMNNGMLLTLEGPAFGDRQFRPRSTALPDGTSPFADLWDALMFETQIDGTVKILRNSTSADPGGVGSTLYVNVEEDGKLMSVQPFVGDTGKFCWYYTTDLIITPVNRAGLLKAIYFFDKLNESDWTASSWAAAKAAAFVAQTVYDDPFADQVMVDATAEDMWAAINALTYYDTSGFSTVTGQIKSNNPNNPATIELMQGGAVKHTVTIAVEPGFGQLTQPFTFMDVAPGDYTLVVTKPGHTSFTVQTVTVGNDDLDLTLDSRDAVRVMTLLCGDINGDQMINDNDLIVLWQAANYNKNVEQAANPLCDLNGDGVINDNDLIILWLAVNYNKGPVVVA